MHSAPIGRVSRQVRSKRGVLVFCVGALSLIALPTWAGSNWSADQHRIVAGDFNTTARPMYFCRPPPRRD